MATVEENNRALADPRLSPRQRIKLREQLIKAGVKGTSLHLGAVTPEVLAQLKASEKQQKFFEKKVDLRKLTNLAVSSEGLGSGNTSGAVGQARSRVKAQEVFAIQKAFTKSKGKQVQDVFSSVDFKTIKEGGTKGGTVKTFTSFQELLNKRGVAVPTYERAIVTELAQQDIQGKQSTEQNISRILSNQGFPTVDVKITDQGTLETGSAGGEFLAPIIKSINAGLTGITDTGLPSPTFGFDEPTGEESQVGGFDIMNLLKNPLVWVIILGIIGLVLIKVKK